MLSAQNFHIRCNAAQSGSFEVDATEVSLSVGHRIARESRHEMWDFVLLSCRAVEGQLTTRILVCHPDWDEPLELASIRSDGPSLRIELAQTESHPP